MFLAGKEGHGQKEKEWKEITWDKWGRGLTGHNKGREKLLENQKKGLM